jgi:hypothetical protein
MAWEVEVSDEFAEWWDALEAAEQKSVDFTMTLLSEAGPTLKMPHSSGLRHRATSICANSGFNTKDARTAFFMRSIRAVQQFC